MVCSVDPTVVTIDLRTDTFGHGSPRKKWQQQERMKHVAVTELRRVWDLRTEVRDCEKQF